MNSVSLIYSDVTNLFFLLFVYCKLQSTQLDRVISKGEARKGRETGTIHRWFTAVVLLGCLPAMIV